MENYTFLESVDIVLKCGRKVSMKIVKEKDTNMLFGTEMNFNNVASTALINKLPNLMPISSSQSIAQELTFVVNYRLINKSGYIESFRSEIFGVDYEQALLKLIALHNKAGESIISLECENQKSPKVLINDDKMTLCLKPNSLSKVVVGNAMVLIKRGFEGIKVEVRADCKNIPHALQQYYYPYTELTFDKQAN